MDIKDSSSTTLETYVRTWNHERERPRVTETRQPRFPYSGDVGAPHLPRRRLVAGQPVATRVHDKHPVPRDEPSDEHRHRPVGAGGGRHIRQAVTAPAEHPPAVADPSRGPLRRERPRHRPRCGAEATRPDPVHLRVHAQLFRREQRGPRIRFGQGRMTTGIEQRARHHRDRRATGHSVALAQSQTGEFHRLPVC